MVTNSKWLVISTLSVEVLFCILLAPRQDTLLLARIRARQDVRQHFASASKAVGKACELEVAAQSTFQRIMKITKTTISTIPRSQTPEWKRTSRLDKITALFSDANIRNFAPVARIMKNALPDNAKIAKEAKECMQECVSEFISFITSEGGSSPTIALKASHC